MLLEVYGVKELAKVMEDQGAARVREAFGLAVTECKARHRLQVL